MRKPTDTPKELARSTVLVLCFLVLALVLTAYLTIQKSQDGRDFQNVMEKHEDGRRDWEARRTESALAESAIIDLEPLTSSINSRRLRLRVVDKMGRPVDGAVVRSLSRDDFKTSRSIPYSATERIGQTEASGLYELEADDSRTWNDKALLVEHSTSESIYILDLKWGTTTTVVLRKATTVTVPVVDCWGDPIQGVTVMLSPSALPYREFDEKFIPGFDSSIGIHSALSDIGGHAVISCVADGDYHIRAYRRFFEAIAVPQDGVVRIAGSGYETESVVMQPLLGVAIRWPIPDEQLNMISGFPFSVPFDIRERASALRDAREYLQQKFPMSEIELFYPDRALMSDRHPWFSVKAINSRLGYLKFNVRATPIDEVSEYLAKEDDAVILNGDPIDGVVTTVRILQPDQTRFNGAIALMCMPTRASLPVHLRDKQPIHRVIQETPTRMIACDYTVLPAEPILEEAIPARDVSMRPSANKVVDVVAKRRLANVVFELRSQTEDSPLCSIRIRSESNRLMSLLLPMHKPVALAYGVYECELVVSEAEVALSRFVVNSDEVKIVIEKAHH